MGLPTRPTATARALALTWVCAGLVSLPTACSLNRAPEPAAAAASEDVWEEAEACGTGAACVPSSQCSCSGQGGQGTGGNGGNGGTGGTGGDGDGTMFGSGGMQPIDGTGGMNGGTGGMNGGTGGRMVNYPTANPLNVTPGATQGTCPMGFRCSNTQAFGTVCTELDGSSRVCAMNPDCIEYGADAICQFTPTFQAYCFQLCTP